VALIKQFAIGDGRREWLSNLFERLLSAIEAWRLISGLNSLADVPERTEPHVVQSNDTYRSLTVAQISNISIPLGSVCKFCIPSFDIILAARDCRDAARRMFADCADQ
jgi:hypothetical protein